MPVVQVFEFHVDGPPVQQGSKTAYIRGGRAMVTDQNQKTLRPYRERVSYAAGQAYRGEQLEGAVVIVLEFSFVRPKSVRRDRPFVKPDIDKLQRSVLDALTDSGVIRDDAQVTKITAEKVYAESAGVHVRVGQYLPGPSALNAAGGQTTRHSSAPGDQSAPFSPKGKQ